MSQIKVCARCHDKYKGVYEDKCPCAFASRKECAYCGHKNALRGGNPGRAKSKPVRLRFRNDFFDGVDVLSVLFGGRVLSADGVKNEAESRHNGGCECEVKGHVESFA